MKGVNKVILVGIVGKDPVIKNFPNGGKLSLLSMATSDSWTDKNTGERKEVTEWHRIRASDGLANIIEKYVKKGSKLYIEGSLKTRQWTDQNGQEKYATEIHVKDMQMLDERKAGNSPQPGGQTTAPVDTSHVTHPNQPQAYRGHSPPGGGGSSDLDDDLPFAAVPSYPF